MPKSYEKKLPKYGKTTYGVSNWGTQNQTFLNLWKFMLGMTSAI
jgi:hypothetical protein